MLAPRSIDIAPNGLLYLVLREGNKVLVIDGRNWKQGQTAAGVADRAKTLYGDRYGEFLDNVKAFAYFPYAVATGVEDFRQGEITLRFKPISGRIDQGELP